MSIKTLTKQVWDIEYKVEIDYAEFVDSPREYNELSKLCIRKHRNYNFPNELGFDFDAFDDWEMELPVLEENQKLFWLDFYEHSGISFSLAGQGMQCKFDTSWKCGFIICENEEQAKAEIKEYNQWLNWDCYRVDVSERSVIEKDWKIFYSEWENLDCMSCIGWNNLEAPSHFSFEEWEWEKFIN